MAAEKSSEPSELALAALALDRELERFQHLAQAAARLPLTSRRNLDRAARAVDEATGSEVRLGPAMQRLSAALVAAQQTNQESVQALETRRGELQERTTAVRGLLDRMTLLAKAAGEISAVVARISRAGQEGEVEGVPDAIAEVEIQMERIVDELKVLGGGAREARVEDLESEIDSLRQQVLSAKNKIRLLREQLDARN